MAQLLDRNRQIPGGLTFLQPESTWRPVPWSSFESICQQLQQHRRGNPWLAKKNKWAIDYQGIAVEVDAYNTKLCEAHGWHEFIVSVEGRPPNWPPPHPPEGGLVAGAKRTVAGVKLVRDWLGSGLKPVERRLATQRAAICTECPLNLAGTFWQKLDELAARQVRTLMSIKADLECKTDYDERLQSCQACDCWNPLKVWTPIGHILKNTSAEVRDRIVNGMMIDGKLVKAKDCWILREETA